MKFSITHKDSQTQARVALMELPHGVVETPIFMPVGTQATVKGIQPEEIPPLGYNLILSNTYHLFLRPGVDIIRAHGGLHDFMQWKGNVLTDSGGFQVFSLSSLRSIKPEGVYFKSHLDGTRILFTPENVVETQVAFNSDIQMVLDVCTPPDITEKKAKDACFITTKWAQRAKIVYDAEKEKGYKGSLFGIVQGNFFKDLRKMSAETLVELDFPGYAIGGLSVGEKFPVFEEYLAYTTPFLPETKPRYLMGIGTPEYILSAVEQGIDMFDCVFPTRIARNGTFFTRDGRIAIKNEIHKNDLGPIEEDSPINKYSKAYIRHLFKANEMLGPIIATKHNLYFLYRMMEEIKVSIREGKFLAYKKNFLERYGRA